MSTLSVNKITDLTDFTFPPTTTLNVVGVTGSGTSTFGSANTANLSVTGSASITGNLNVSNNIVVSGSANVGNLSVTGTSGRITGDFSNATVANRVLFQTSTANGNSRIGVVPNGTGQISALDLHSTSDASNYQRLTFGIVGSSDGRITVDQSGSGTYLPMTFYTGGSERMRLSNTGNFSIGTANTDTFKLNVNGNANISGTLTVNGTNITGGSSGVTSITAGTGLSGGTITTSGTIALVTTLGAVGTYALLKSSSSVTAGSTYAGSTLQYTGSRLINNGCAGIAFLPNQSAAASPSGTWQAMGTVVTDPSGQYAGTLFIRIS